MLWSGSMAWPFQRRDEMAPSQRFELLITQYAAIGRRHEDGKREIPQVA